MQKKSLYFDTSVISGYFDERNPERMKMTMDSFNNITGYYCYVSDLVVAEINGASSEMQEKMLDLIKEFAVLSFDDDELKLAREYVSRGIFPQRFIDDAVHVAIASTNSIDIIVSWSFKHLVKIKTRDMIKQTNQEIGYPVVEIVSPPEL